MLAAAAVSAVGAFATALAMRQADLGSLFVVGWVLLGLGAIVFLRGFWQFVRG